MAELFATSKQAISYHIVNILKENELTKDSVVKEFLTTAADGKSYNVIFYSLEMIIAVGYRVRGVRGTQFRQWATKIIKDYMLRGYAVNQRLLNIENQLASQQKQLAHHQEQIDFFVRTSLPPVEGIFYDGQISCHFSISASLLCIFFRPNRPIFAPIPPPYLRPVPRFRVCCGLRPRHEHL
jgi:hypothetical protein